ncbi:hypothetical protein EfmAA242_32900 (plasmid) [Enterococcus faecium]|nr:hypothetical protein EfmAA242_32900 [Enterococcus faecium]
MENYNVKIKKIKRWNFIALILCAVEIVLSIFDLHLIQIKLLIKN